MDVPGAAKVLMSRVESVCVFLGSSVGARPEYIAAAKTLGTLLAVRGKKLIYGGASIGLMGAVAEAALAAGGEVVGIIPQALVDHEVAHHGVTELVVTGSMHERKAEMARRSDAFVALPGGVGTLEELFEVWTWNQLGIYDKPCALLNVAGYFDALVGFLDHMAAEKFIRPPHRAMLAVAETPEALLEAIETYAPPVVEKWIGIEQT
jgi:uncharacterized protein (TIGR00730 family)